MNNEYKHFQNAVKLVTYLQLALESIDDFKGSVLYRHSLKNKMNALEKEITSVLLTPLKQIDKDTDGSELFNMIQEKVELIMSLSLEDFTMLKQEIEEAKTPTNSKK